MRTYYPPDGLTIEIKKTSKSFKIEVTSKKLNKVYNRKWNQYTHQENLD